MKLRIRFLLITSYVIYSQLLVSQTINSIDSLNSVLRLIESPNEKADAILRFLEEPENQYSEDTDELARRALSISQQSSYYQGRVNSMILIAFCHFRASEYKKALEMAYEAMEISEDMNYDLGLAKSMRLIGSICDALDDHDLGSRFFFDSLKIFEKLKDKSGISLVLGDIGIGFFNQQDYKKALDYYNKSLSIAQEINSLTVIKKQYNNIAVAYGGMQNYDTAILFFNKAIDINIKLGDKLGWGLNIMNVGYDQMNQEKYQDAFVSFQKALDFFVETNNKYHLAECYINYGYCYFSSNMTEQGVYYFKKALQVGNENSFYRIIHSSAEILNKIYSQKRDTLNAYKYLTIQKVAQDSLYAKNKLKLLSKLELQYLNDKKEFRRKLEDQRKNNLTRVIIFGLVSGIIILILLLSRFRLKSKFIILEKEKIEVELHSKDKELTVNLISLIKKNEMLASISNKLIFFQQNAKGTEAKEIANSISQEIRNTTDDKMLNEFTTRFQEVHAGFYETLLLKFPDLTQNELKLCAFLRLNMSSKDISELTGQYPPSIDRARYRLRKKLGISNSETNLVTFLSQI